jgi:signal transduction histidine kinase
MRIPVLGRVLSGPALVRQFALLSFLVIGLLTAALAALLANQFREDLLEREWALTADHVRTAILQHLRPADLSRPLSAAGQRRLEQLSQQTIAMPEVVRMAVYDASRRLIWSDDPDPRGGAAPPSPHLARALSGLPVVNLEPGHWPGLFLWEQNEFARLVEVYVPIVFPGASKVAGVVVIGKLPRQVFTSIRRGQATVVGSAAAGGLLLYLALFWIVQGAARRIEEQRVALTARTEELTAANQELRAVQAQLVAAERMAAIGEVVTAVAHGIRNPLANIRASAQVASLGGDAGSHLSTIMAEVDRLEGRLKEMLHFVRPAGPERLPLDVNQGVQDAVRLMAGNAEAAGVTVRAELRPGLPRILGNAMLLEQVFLSLLGNAVEATPAGGSVTVRTGLQSVNGAGPPVFVEVRDTGGGIPPEHLPRIFEPFYTTKAKGTGLGLAIAKKFTEAQGGSLGVQSRRGATAFTITFPALEDPACPPSS